MDKLDAFFKAIDNALRKETEGVVDNRHKPEDYISFKNKCYFCGKPIDKNTRTIATQEGVGFLCKECTYSRM